MTQSKVQFRSNWNELFSANHFGNIIYALSKVKVNPKTWKSCSNYIVKMHNVVKETENQID